MEKRKEMKDDKGRKEKSEKKGRKKRISNIADKEGRSKI